MLPMPNGTMPGLCSIMTTGEKSSITYCLFDRWSDETSIDLLDSESISKISLLGWDGEIPCLYAWTLKIDLN